MGTQPDLDTLDGRDDEELEASEDARIDRALREAMREALLHHKRAGNSIPIFRDGRVVELPAEQVDLPVD